MPPKRTLSRTVALRQVKVKTVATAVGFVTLAALGSATSQASLAPVYGSLPSASLHQTLVTSTALLGFVVHSRFKQRPLFDFRSWLPVLALWIPVVQFLLLQSSASLGPRVGPTLTEALTYLPLLFGSCYAAVEVMETSDLSARFVRRLVNFLLPVIAYAYLSIAATAFKSVLPRLFLVSDVFTPVNISLLIGSIYAFITPSKLCILAIPAMIHTALMNPHYSSLHTTSLLNKALRAHNWSLVDRQWSNTGYLSVLENANMQYRVMRCDHSLLGGEWLLTDHRRQTENWKVPEPIYAVFEMLESVRLIDAEQPPDSEANALVIGLGIGTAPKALLAHGINTTIVELDPIVHEFALLYFDLPTNHTAVLEDAISWVDKTANQNARTARLAGLDALEYEHLPQEARADLAQGTTYYDYIIHDVFTGGAEPLPLFTKEFLKDLRSLLTKDGVIAINYAGEHGTKSSSLVLNTIDIVFDGQCKIFRDNPPLAVNDGTNDKFTVDFLNMVVFCRNSPGDITFRQPIEADFLGSQSRRHYLRPLGELEIPFPYRADCDGDIEECRHRSQKVLRRDNVHEWEGKQTDSAIRHWEIMRKVVPAQVWELW